MEEEEVEGVRWRRRWTSLQQEEVEGEEEEEEVEKVVSEMEAEKGEKELCRRCFETPDEES